LREKTGSVVMRKHPLTFYLVFLFFVSWNTGALAHTDVTVQEARSMIDIGLIPPALGLQVMVSPEVMHDFIIVDVREATTEFCSKGHIPGAVNYPWNSQVLQQRYNELPKTGDILVVCGSGTRSNSAAEFLDGKGFTHVYDMKRGMGAWNDEGWETVKCGHDDPGIVDIIGDLDGDGKVGLQETIYILQRVRKFR